jgi:energy-coupling factor transporter transmembrane protein EcfT
MKAKQHVVSSLILLALIGLVIYVLNNPFIMSIILLFSLIYFSVWASIKAYKRIHQMVKNFMS